MQKFIHNISLLASLIALAAALWQDWGVWLTVERMLVSYLAFFFFGSFLSLAMRAIPLLEGKTNAPGQVQGDGMESAIGGKSHLTGKAGK